MLMPKQWLESLKCPLGASRTLQSSHLVEGTCPILSCTRSRPFPAEQQKSRHGADGDMTMGGANKRKASIVSDEEDSDEEANQREPR